MQVKRSEFVSLIPRLHPWPSINFFSGNVPKDEMENLDFWVPQHHSNGYEP